MNILRLKKSKPVKSISISTNPYFLGISPTCPTRTDIAQMVLPGCWRRLREGRFATIPALKGYWSRESPVNASRLPGILTTIVVEGQSYLIR
jgi:hypothetical protein